MINCTGTGPGILISATKDVRGTVRIGSGATVKGYVSMAPEVHIPAYMMGMSL